MIFKQEIVFCKLRFFREALLTFVQWFKTRIPSVRPFGRSYVRPSVRKIIDFCEEYMKAVICHRLERWGHSYQRRSGALEPEVSRRNASPADPPRLIFGEGRGEIFDIFLNT